MKGGYARYAALGAPNGLVYLASTDSLRPAVSCVVIAAALLACAAYAFSGAGVLRRLPLLRSVLALVGLRLLLRSVAFIAVAAWQPSRLAGLCGRCEGVTGFLIVTSLVCLFVAAGFLRAALRAKR